ncbi:MAG: aminoacetone oxidase family FAD-binding enzyme, partial [Acidobacteriaceae bacterium]
GYQLAAQFGVAIQPCRPALVPLLFSNSDLANYSDLAGVAAPVLVHCGSAQFRENMLLTHRGLSGPAILQISSYWRPGQSIEIDLAPNVELTRPWHDPSLPRNLSTAKQLLRSTLPHRLADRWLALHPPQGWSNDSLTVWERQLHHWTIVPAGTEGYAKAEVTAGGIDTNELSAKTMECRNVPGMYFIGEVVDVTGYLGGFNFQWAWASGFCAGQALAA